MKIIISSIVLLCNLNLFSQTISIKELVEKSNCKTYECYKTFILSKGFVFLKKKGIIDIYQSIDKYQCTDTKLDQSDLSFFQISNDFTMASVQTVDETYYKDLLRQLDDFGFKFIKMTNSDKNSVQLLYRSNSNIEAYIEIVKSKKCDSFSFSIAKDK